MLASLNKSKINYFLCWYIFLIESYTSFNYFTNSEIIYFLDIDDCDPNPCQNNGTCHDGVNNYTCECMPGFTGDNCAISKSLHNPISCYLCLMNRKLKINYL